MFAPERISAEVDVGAAKENPEELAVDCWPIQPLLVTENGIATANDRGAACAQACADDDQCKGFTWVDPRARGGTAMCYKKNRLNGPVADNFTNSGIVRPG